MFPSLNRNKSDTPSFSSGGTKSLIDDDDDTYDVFPSIPSLSRNVSDTSQSSRYVNDTPKLSRNVSDTGVRREGLRQNPPKTEFFSFDTKKDTEDKINLPKVVTQEEVLQKRRDDMKNLRIRQAQLEKEKLRAQAEIEGLQKFEVNTRSFSNLYSHNWENERHNTLMKGLAKRDEELTSQIQKKNAEFVASQILSLTRSDDAMKGMINDEIAKMNTAEQKRFYSMTQEQQNKILKDREKVIKQSNKEIKHDNKGIIQDIGISFQDDYERNRLYYEGKQARKEEKQAGAAKTRQDTKDEIDRVERKKDYENYMLIRNSKEGQRLIKEAGNKSGYHLTTYEERLLLDPKFADKQRELMLENIMKQEQKDLETLKTIDKDLEKKKVIKILDKYTKKQKPKEEKEDGVVKGLVKETFMEKFTGTLQDTLLGFLQG